MIKVAFIGAPDSGKTTMCKMVSSRLNLKGYVPAYVHEFARDYITKYGIRPNTVAEQFYVLNVQEQREREMCTGSTQVMYTDAPIILSYIYAIDLVRDAKDLDMLSELYGKVLRLLGNANAQGGLRDSLQICKPRYDLIFLLRPFRKTVIDDVRAVDLNRLDRLDVQMRGFLDLHGFPYQELTQDFNERLDVVESAILKKIGEENANSKG